MSARTPVPLGVAEVQIDAQLRALDARIKQYRKVVSMRWSNKHVPPSAPIDQIIKRAVDEIVDIQAHTKETT